MYQNNELFKNKYRVDSVRLKGWDYSWPGYYFITICTKNQIHFFGEVKNEKMYLSDIGRIIEDEWLKTGQIRKNVKLDKFVVMPNHIHGILVIGDENYRVEALRRNASTASDKNNFMSGISPKPNSLSEIIRSFKSVCTKKICKINPTFAWQSRFYDHIIRNEKSLNNIRQYIIDNPKKWWRDRNNQDGLYI